VYVREVGRDELIVSLNSEVPRSPASTMKVLTTYAALELLGPAYTWRTRAYATTPVRAIRGSVRDSVRHGFTDLHNLDFFYAAGLFDYLDDRLGRRLLSRMFDCLRPGGLLWIANFVPDIADRAYMEAVMDWWLVYRTPDALGTLDAEIDSHQIAHKRVFLEGEQNVAVLELRKL